MEAPAEVLRLVETFDRNIETYKGTNYNETQVRHEFIDPFFTALGWDVNNTGGLAEAYKDVIHEDSIRIGSALKAPDYCFRIGGTRKFFIEAKKPSINIKNEPHPAFQLRRYAWSAKLPLSILTDFEEFAVYDCRTRPVKTDRASTARILYIKYTEYIDRWNEIAGIFSKDAILKGSFDKYAVSKRKKGTAEVDTAFLTEIEGWRDVLAKNIALRNPSITNRQLNFAVQRTIDRIIFLRIAEDRGIEKYAQLQSILNGHNTYERLFTIFKHADDRYNSGLFHFTPEPGRTDYDDLSSTLSIDDKPLKDIIKSLYYPDCPYAFSVLPAEILGQIYEQFLGKVITLTTGHRAKIDDKPEVKKAGGVYYTPAYIVDYIVKNTVGKLLENKTPATASKLKILDPACGSGSFLIGAYQHLLDWHLKYYTENDPKKYLKSKQPKLYETAKKELRLTVAERKRILTNNIFGVDIDTQAVEVTKLSLLLKVLEGERQLVLFHRERALPDLSTNIKCGNSLIGPDFYKNQQLTMFDEEEQYKINAFDWKTEFPEILNRKTPGFDAIIGNPPWGQKGVSWDNDTKLYLRNNYTSVSGILDIFRPFVERGIILTRFTGMFGFVLPDIVLLKDYEDTRKFILEKLTITKIDWWGMSFASAVIDASTIIGHKKTAPQNHLVAVNVHDLESPISHKLLQSDFKKNPRCVFNLFLTKEKRKTLEELKNYPKVGDLFEIHEGVHSGNIRKELFVDEPVDDTCQQLLFGRDEITPYHLKWNGRYIRLSVMPENKSKKRYANSGRPEWYAQEKVLVRRTGDFVLAALDSENRYASNNFFILFPKTTSSLDLAGLCAVLNSKIATWYFRTIEPRKGRVFAELKIKNLRVLPIPSSALTPNGCEQLNKLARQRIEHAKKIFEAKTSQDKNVITRICYHLDQKIDEHVIRLFDIELPHELKIEK